jgi:hypothetical protein
MRFRLAVLALSALVSGCGGSSADSPGSPSPNLSLPDGDYLLAVYSSGFGCVVSSHGQGGAPNSAVQIPVSVSRDGDDWRVTSREQAAGSLAMTLVPNAVGVDGNATGTLVQPGVSVTLQHQVTGTGSGAADGLVGSVNGTVNYAGASATAFCSTNLWSLSKHTAGR